MFLRCLQEKLASYHLTIGPRICCLSHNLSSFATLLEHYFWYPNRYQTHFFTTSKKKAFHTYFVGGLQFVEGVEGTKMNQRGIFERAKCKICSDHQMVQGRIDDISYIIRLA